MPTSQQEAERIVSIIGEYIDYETAAAIMHKLYDEVGQHTENESLAEDDDFVTNVLYEILP